MKTKFIFVPLLTIGSMAFASVVAASSQDGTVKPNFAHTIPNIPGKSLVAVEVSYPSGGATPAHTHARSAFIYAYVVSGQIVSQVEGEPEHTYRAGRKLLRDAGSASSYQSQREPD
jgi:quercetin dioxygenase-like cupin family protein